MLPGAVASQQSGLARLAAALGRGAAAAGNRASGEDLLLMCRAPLQQAAAAAAALLQPQQHLPQQQTHHQLRHHATTTSSAAAAVAVPALAAAPAAAPRRGALAAAAAAALSPPRRAARGIVAQYPFPVSYYAPRRTALLRGADAQPLADVELPGDVFNVPVRLDILHQVVRWQRAKARQGTHKVKDRSEVSGGGRKPWQQKGSGKARQGSRRAPQWRGGGVVHGPTPRSHAFALPKKVRRLGLKCALSAKANEGRLLLVDSLAPPDGSPKTGAMAARLVRLLGCAPRLSALLVDSAKDGDDGGELMRRASRNLPGVEVVPALGANVYSILRRDVLVLTRPAADALVERLRRPINRLGAAGRAAAARLAARRAAAEVAARRRAAIGGADEAAAAAGP